ncbi:MAG TPA: DUF192 domain-containing protein [Chthoniobacterales bacterium]|jgi:uncharacterized membrane protein (UPF0127 family)
MFRPVACFLFASLLFSGTVLSQVPDKPQPKLPTISLSIGDRKLATEVADDDTERETGMMFRTEMADGTAMLFVFNVPQRRGFWMKNTIIPLSVAYLNASGMILEIHDLQPKDERAVTSQFDTIAYAIEVPQGWFSKNGILPGSMVTGLPPLARQ